MKKLIKEYEKLNPGCKIKYIPENFASIEIYNSGGLIAILEPFELRVEVERMLKNKAEVRDKKLSELLGEIKTNGYGEY
jgi:hypothetical protein